MLTKFLRITKNRKLTFVKNSLNSQSKILKPKNSYKVTGV